MSSRPSGSTPTWAGGKANSITAEDGKFVRKMLARKGHATPPLDPTFWLTSAEVPEQPTGDIGDVEDPRIEVFARRKGCRV